MENHVGMKLFHPQASKAVFLKLPICEYFLFLSLSVSAASLRDTGMLISTNYKENWLSTRPN